MTNKNNGSEWLRFGDKNYQINNIDDALDCYLNAIQSEDIDANDKVSALIKISTIEWNNGDINSAFKYCALASICTETPRPDVCCLMSELYYSSDVIDWAIFWAERAMFNPMDDSEYTWLPISLLSKYYYKLGNYEKANEYADAVLKLVPDNEDAIENKKSIEKMLNPN